MRQTFPIDNAQLPMGSVSPKLTGQLKTKGRKLLL